MLSFFANAIRRLRTEELLALVFFLPMAFLTFYFVGEKGYPTGAEARFYITLALIVIYVFCQYKFSDNKIVGIVRDIAPFVFCIAIYTNLHDLVYFVHPTNIDDKLIAIDQKLLGCQLSIVAQSFRPTWLIKWLEFNYSLFFYYPAGFGLILYLQKRKIEYRIFLVSLILTFFAGYFLYTIFPAVGPKIYLKEYFQNPDLLSWRVEEDLYKFFSIQPGARRDAFPSLHNAGTLVVMLFAYKYEKRFFFIALPFAISLMIATIYLGHHYLIDVLAGWLLAILAFIYFPKFENYRLSKNSNKT